MAENKIIIDCRVKELSALFAELACESATLANLILKRYPEYRHAKQLPRHPFWKTSFALMKGDVLLAMSHEEQKAGQMLAA